VILTILVTFIITTALYVALGAWGTRRVVRHLMANRDAVQAVTEHVLMPLLGHTPQEGEKTKPLPKDARLC